MINCSLHIPSLLLAPLALAAVAPAAAVEQPPDPARVKAIAAMLPQRPVGLGRPITDRATWAKLAADPAYAGIIPQAEKLLGQPIPDQPDDLFLEFSRNGNRTRWQNVAFRRRAGLVTLVLAECLENKGRFLPAIAALTTALCAERTWVMPAHDGSLANFNGKTVDIDLASSALGWEFATADYLLADKLPTETRSTIRENLKRRILDPYRAMFTGQRAPNWWMLTTNNWNAVCLAGVAGTALAELETREARAEFIAAAEKYSRNFLAGFTPDGYCSEGLGYWNYGFGHYLLLAETIRQATAGGVDLLALPEVRMPATFGARIEIQDGVSPAFADCSVNARPDSSIMYFVNKRFGLGLAAYNTVKPPLGTLFEAMIYSFPNAASQAPAGGQAEKLGLRTWFDKAGILIGRPAPGSACRLGVALKGGNNAEHHNHNDVGSYVVVCGDRPVLLDPGAETYTARTFSSRRYESKLLNSFGHPVPVVAGQLQREGAQAHGEILRTDFTDAADTLEMEMASAYPCPDLESLRRTFVYSRQGAGSLTVTDHVRLKTPQTFGTAILTRGSWQKLDDGSLLVYDVDQAVRVTVDAGGAGYAIQEEEIHEDAPVTPVRLGINLAKPVTDATVTVKIVPMEMPREASGGLLPNGSFEFGAWGWELPRNGLGAISDEKAASGKHSLKISDQSKNAGSNVSSGRIPVGGDTALLLRGKVFHAAGQGIGIYAKCLDADGRTLNPTDAQGNIAPVISLTGDAGKWVPFAAPFRTPAGTTSVQLWIHSFNGAEVEAYLDDLEIVKQ